MLALTGCSSSARRDASAKSATASTSTPSAGTSPSTRTNAPAGLVRFDELAYPAPAGFTLKDDTYEDIASPIPGGQPASERFRSYVDAGGNGIYLFCFRGFSGRDRGPMKAEASWTLKLDGREARLSETSMFFGTQQHLLTAHFDGPSGADYLVYTTRIDRPAFETFLRTLSFR